MSFDLADFSYSRQRRQTRVGAAVSHFTVRIKSQIVGLPVHCVKTVFYIDRLTPVPLAPPEVAGLANLRGRIVTGSASRQMFAHRLGETERRAFGRRHHP